MPHLQDDQGAPLLGLTDDPRNFFLKTIMLYGASNSGKSTIMKDLIFRLKPYIPNVCAFLGSAGAYDDLKDIIPESCIKREFTLKALQDLFDRQTEAMDAYNTATATKNLAVLFQRIASHDARVKEEKLQQSANTALDAILRQDERDQVTKEEQIAVVRKEADNFLNKLYKRECMAKKEILKGMEATLSSIEQVTLKFLNFNPYVLLIVDDCGPAITKKIQNSKVFKEMFMMPRHQGITGLWAFQDDASLVPEIKKQASISFFASQQCASNFFSRDAMGFLKSAREETARLIAQVYDERHTVYPKFTKLIWVRDDAHPFRQFKAIKRGAFTFGSTKLWEMCEKVEESRKTRVTTSSFGVYKRK